MAEIVAPRCQRDRAVPFGLSTAQLLRTLTIRQVGARRQCFIHFVQELINQRKEWKALDR